MKCRVIPSVVGMGIVAGLVTFAAVMSLSLAFGLSGTVSTDVENQTTLTEIADSVQTWICVEDGSAFTVGVTICIDSDADTSCENAGDLEEEEKVVGVRPGGYCTEGDEVPLTTRLDQVHLIGALVHRMPCVEVTPSPTPTATPTPTPTPTPAPTPTPTLNQTYNCPQAGKWAIAVWQGPDGVAAGEALATCGEGAVDAAYALDASSGEWLRWFADRPEISNLPTVENMQGFIALGSSTASPSPTVKLEPPEPGRMRGCPLPGRWAIAVWEGPDASEVGEALDTCGVWQADVAYSLHPGTGAWARWFRDRPELATLDLFAASTPAVVLGGRQPELRLPGPIAFVSERDGNPEIYVMNADGTGHTRLTYNSTAYKYVNAPGWDYSRARDDSPAWSPDGSKIAFTSHRYGNDEIFVMNANGSMQANLTNHPATDKSPAWSPDGTKIAFYSGRDGNAEIYVMNADGTGQTRLTNNAAYDRMPAWSPDGTKIAFHSGRDGNAEIYVMNANGTVQANATLNGAEDRSPAWSPDGSKIAFASNRDGDYDIYVMNADGTGQTRLTFYSTRDDIHPSWSRDGTKIAFEAAWAGGNSDIWVMNADGTVQILLTTNDATDAAPAWSPW